jgi:hypothetical protein
MTVIARLLEVLKLQALKFMEYTNYQMQEPVKAAMTGNTSLHELWHRFLGHFNQKVVKILKNGLVSGANLQVSFSNFAFHALKGSRARRASVSNKEAEGQRIIGTNSFICVWTRAKY